MPATVPLGDAYVGCAAVVVDAYHSPAALGDVGELWLAGAQVSDGYINSPKEQVAKFIDADLPGDRHRRWYRSGDLVRRDPDWGLIYCNRLDDQIKISGYRVELLEIEEALRWAADTPEVAIVPWPLADSGAAEGVVGFVCGAKFAARETIQRCRKLLPPYMAPKRFMRWTRCHSMRMARWIAEPFGGYILRRHRSFLPTHFAARVQRLVQLSEAALFFGLSIRAGGTISVRCPYFPG